MCILQDVLRRLKQKRSGILSQPPEKSCAPHPGSPQPSLPCMTRAGSPRQENSPQKRHTESSTQPATKSYSCLLLLIQLILSFTCVDELFHHSESASAIEIPIPHHCIYNQRRGKGCFKFPQAKKLGKSTLDHVFLGLVLKPLGHYINRRCLFLLHFISS